MKKIFDILKRKMFPSKKSNKSAYRLSLMFGLFLFSNLLNIINTNCAFANFGTTTEAYGNVVLSAAVGVTAEKHFDALGETKFGDEYWNLSVGKDLKTLGISEHMEQLRQYANSYKTNYEHIYFVDSKVTDEAQDIAEAISDAIARKGITDHEADIIINEARRLIQEGANKKMTARQSANHWADPKQTQKGVSFAISELSDVCYNMDTIRAKYSAGCWSCMILEKLSSAFMGAAEKGIDVSERAGKVLLGIGAALWIVLWGLRTVSSMTQLEPANVLNELIKFCFKVMLAYAFINSGMSMVKKYFIDPIMGVGAKIATAYWEEDRIKPLTKDFVWDEIDYDALEKQEQDAFTSLKNGTSTTTENTLTTIEYDTGQQALINAQKALDKDAMTSQDVPTFLLPGTNTGRLTSTPGCRIRPETKCTSKSYKVGNKCYGSAHHMGLDIGTQGVEGGVVFAIAGGTIAYSQGTATGYAATIDTKDKYNNNWRHRYLHMQPRSHDDFRFKDNQVATGQQIGYIGNTGNSSGPHLHLELIFSGTWKGKKYNNAYLDPLRLTQGIFHVIDTSKCDGTKKTAASFADGFSYHMDVPKEPWKTTETAVTDLSSTYVQGSSSGSENALIIKFPDIEYNGPTGLISKSVMDSILGATYAISNMMAENMVLGDGIMCYAKLRDGGAWHIFDWYFTNIFMWIQGAFIWCTGLLLSIAFVFYLLDIALKIGFAAMALPLAVGLWPFEVTKDKVGVCFSIIAKAAATYAFIAMTTMFIIHINEAVFNIEFGETSSESDSGATGLARIYETFDAARTGDATSADMTYIRHKLDLFSSTFVLLLFAFLYSYKLLQQTVPSLVDKFFPDKGFGSSSPMHHMATAAVKAGKDIAMKPVGWARDAALYQGGRGVNKLIGLGGHGLKKGAGWIGGKITGKGKKKDDKSGSGIGSTMKETSRSIKETASNVKQTAKTAKDGARSVKEGAEAVESASNAADMAGTAMQATAATGVGAPVAAVGVGVSAAAKVTGTISSATKTTAGVAEKSFETVEKVAETVEKVAEVAEKVSEAVEKVEEVAENVKKGAEKAGKSSEKNDNKSGENSKGEK